MVVNPTQHCLCIACHSKATQAWSTRSKHTLHVMLCRLDLPLRSGLRRGAAVAGAVAAGAPPTTLRSVTAAGCHCTQAWVTRLP